MELIKNQIKKCPQCKTEMKKAKFDIGYGVEVDCLNCERCGFNITENKSLENALSHLKKQTTLS